MAAPLAVSTKEEQEFLSRIVTGDEMGVHHYEPESKRQSMEWKHPGSPKKKKIKTQSSAGNVMLTVFWDSKGPILEDYPEKGCTINNASYSDLLANNLKPAIRTKRRGGKRCLNGCATNRKLSSWKEYASLWTAGPSASKRKETI
jgi:hypothetical protein